jgi:hypothetical protein
MQLLSMYLALFLGTILATTDAAIRGLKKGKDLKKGKGMKKSKKLGYPRLSSPCDKLVDPPPCLPLDPKYGDSFPDLGDPRFFLVGNGCSTSISNDESDDDLEGED